MIKKKMKYNLQFFAEENEVDGATASNGTDTSNDATIDSEQDEIDPKAFADLLSERDKKIEQMETEIKKLQKSNAELIVRVNSQSAQENKKSFEENLLDMVGAKPRKE